MPGNSSCTRRRFAEELVTELADPTQCPKCGAKRRNVRGWPANIVGSRDRAENNTSDGRQSFSLHFVRKYRVRELGAGEFVRSRFSNEREITKISGFDLAISGLTEDLTEVPVIIKTLCG
jgi:hypothetical protein